MELQQREINVEEMERMVRESHSLLEKCAEQEVTKRWTQMQEVTKSLFLLKFLMVPIGSVSICLFALLFL